MSKLFERLQPHLEKGMAIQTALTLLEWDMETLAPVSADTYTAKVVGILSDEYFQAYINPDVKKMLEKLEGEKEYNLLSLEERAIIRQLRKLYEQLETIPQKEYREFSELSATATNIWAKAKEQSSFMDFAPVLQQIIDYKKKFAGYRRKKQELLYNVLLEDFEPGFQVEQLDSFFEKFKAEMVPFMKKVTEKNDTIDKSYNYQHYDLEQQRKFAKWMAGYIGFDFNKGVMAESAHPFTTNLHNHDVRMTDHFYEDNLESGIFSIIHESGHAIYEMNIADDITQTLVGTGASMGMHESQSRFFENVVGKSEAFWKPIYGKLVEHFPKQLQEITLEHFIKGMNKVEPGAIRTEADELTYAFHILIRYEIEKMIFSDEIKLKDLPQVWNEKYEQYLGVKPKEDKEGVLQDVHWAGGDFGYFPSYAIGSAVSAQIYYHMKSIMPFEQYLEEGNITPIREYLKDSIHKYGMMKDTNELLKDMMNEEFNPDYYIQYLKEKYRKIYELDINK